MTMGKPIYGLEKKMGMILDRTPPQLLAAAPYQGRGEVVAARLERRPGLSVAAAGDRVAAELPASSFAMTPAAQRAACWLGQAGLASQFVQPGNAGAIKIVIARLDGRVPVSSYWFAGSGRAMTASWVYQPLPNVLGSARPER
jgi:hypothetical protein